MGVDEVVVADVAVVVEVEVVVVVIVVLPIPPIPTSLIIISILAFALWVKRSENSEGFKKESNVEDAKAEICVKKSLQYSG